MTHRSPARDTDPLLDRLLSWYFLINRFRRERRVSDTEIAVIGAGVMGTATAWAIARRGTQVAVLEQFQPANPWGASHGRARIFRLAYPDPLYVRLAQAALPLWRRLEQTTGVDVLTLTGAVDHGDPAALAALVTALHAAGEAVESLTAEQAQARWPGLAFDGQVLHHARAGRIDAEAAVHAFVAGARRAGGHVLTASAVEHLEIRGEDDVRLHTPSGVVRARQVVVAAGGWTPDLLHGLGDSVLDLTLPPMRVTQEQPALFAPITAPWPSFVHHRSGGTATAPTGIAAYGTGGTEGVKVGHHGTGRVVRPTGRFRDAGQIDHAELTALQAYARRWLPGVDVERVVPQTCTYTSTVDTDFVIDRVGPVTVAAGFSGHGFKFAPVIGELVADLVLDVRSAVPPDLFDLAAKRFSLQRVRVGV
jgi:sarcosine oxidase